MKPIAKLEQLHLSCRLRISYLFAVAVGNEEDIVDVGNATSIIIKD